MGKTRTPRKPLFFAPCHKRLSTGKLLRQFNPLLKSCIFRTSQKYRIYVIFAFLNPTSGTERIFVSCRILKLLPMKMFRLNSHYHKEGNDINLRTWSKTYLYINSATMTSPPLPNDYRQKAFNIWQLFPASAALIYVN